MIEASQMISPLISALPPDSLAFILRWIRRYNWL